MSMTEEQKPFEYMELKSMCMLCAAHASSMFAFPDQMKFKSEVEAREWLEEKIDEIISLRWDAPDKKAVK